MDRRSVVSRAADDGKASLSAHVGRLRAISDAGGRISFVQVYTVARRPAEAFVAPLSNDEVDHIVKLVKNQARLPSEAFYGSV